MKLLQLNKADYTEPLIKESGIFIKCKCLDVLRKKRMSQRQFINLHSMNTFARVME